MSKRSTAVAGSFYPADAPSVLNMINHFNDIVNNHPDTERYISSLSGRAVIVPHAGWVYSGFTANIAFRALSHANPSIWVVIGPSHRIGFEGVSICDADSYQTPLGELAIDRGLVAELKNRFALSTVAQAHHEHSTEVQMPFIKHYHPSARVVELVYGYSNPAQIFPIVQYLLETSGVAVVISTDLSHYYSLQDAKQLDSICLDAIRNENTDRLHQGCEACGIIGVEAMLLAAKSKGLRSVLLDYRTSADASGDDSRVVGYASALFV